MGSPRTALAAGALAAALVAAIAAGAPAAHHPRPRSAPVLSPGAAEAQLLAALQTRLTAARTLESATLAAVDQRLRAIYAEPVEDPLTALLAGDLQQAQALGELESAITRSDQALLSEYTNSLANLQTAQAEFDQNTLRLTAARRIAAARRAAQTADVGAPTVAPHAAAADVPGGGLPAAIAAQHSLPGPVPIDPRTGRPYPVAGT